MNTSLTQINNPHEDIRSHFNNELLLEKDAAKFLKVSTRTLQAWRWKGGGPLYVRVGYRIVRYRLEDLRNFVADRLKSSTANA